MKSIVILLIALLIGNQQLMAVQEHSPRKKVGLVLSGGGAKGTAHIGAIKVIEELGIPIVTEKEFAEEFLGG